jgi:prepilin-type N-terminal cleavage/methylation domain-containing protein
MMIRTFTHRYRYRPVRVLARAGFTLIELLVVVIVIGILIALLLPVIAGALRTAKNAAVQAEINNMASALASFKSAYGDYPPSRILLCENGYYGNLINSNQGVNTIDPTASPSDTTVAILAQRSLTALRKFFPKVVFTTGTTAPPNVNGTNVYYDFNGNGVMDVNPYVLHGHECLVFFLGGIPYQDPATGTFGMTGFGKDPVNPFTNSLASDSRAPWNGAPNGLYSANRQSPLYEFNGGRLFLDPSNTSNNGANPGIPGYYDSLTSNQPGTALGTLNFYVYFCGYGNGGYDPNDVNFLTEADANLASPIWLQFFTATSLNHRVSPAPNPYTVTSTVTANNAVTYEKAQTFQLFSAGNDGLYGVGGQYVAPSSGTATSSTALPFDGNDTFSGQPAVATTDPTIRQREQDNLTNFKSGTLQ